MNTDADHPLDPEPNKFVKFFTGPSINEGWREPSASEARLIAVWIKESNRKELKYFYVIPVLLPFLSIPLLIDGFTGKKEWTSVLWLCGLLAVFVAIIIVCGLIDKTIKKRRLDGDYQIVDAVVTSRKEVDSEYFIDVRTVLDDRTTLTVQKPIYDAVAPGVPGYLVGYSKDTFPKMYKPKHFIPTERVKEPPEEA